MEKLVIFDWDGTLCDSLCRITECMQLTASETGIARPTEEQVKEVVGLGLREAFLFLYPDADEESLERMRSAYSQFFVQLDSEKPSPLYQGVPEVLQRLKSEGFRLAIATGKSRRGLDRVLDSTGLKELFHSSRCADETRSKPDPLMLIELLDEFSVPSNHAIFIGDSEFDMAMAQMIGMPRVGVAYGTHSLERLSKYQLNYTASHIHEVEKAVIHWSGINQ